MKLKYKIDKGIGTKASLGLIVLQTDATIEWEFSQIFNIAGVALYQSRISTTNSVTQENLAKMESQLPQSVSLLPTSVNFSVIGYGCTSAATVIGSKKIKQIIQTIKPKTKITDPTRAIIAATSFLSAKRIGFVTPYIASVSLAMRKLLEKAGLEIVAFGSFEQDDDRVVAKISCKSILAAIKDVASRANCDLVFVSCTNLRVLEIVNQAEKLIGIPVVSSNLALAWDMLRLAKIDPQHSNLGKLFKNKF